MLLGQLKQQQVASQHLETGREGVKKRGGEKEIQQEGTIRHLGGGNQRRVWKGEKWGWRGEGGVEPEQGKEACLDPGRKHGVRNRGGGGGGRTLRERMS